MNILTFLKMVMNTIQDAQHCTFYPEIQSSISYNSQSQQTNMNLYKNDMTALINIDSTSNCVSNDQVECSQFSQFTNNNEARSNYNFLFENELNQDDESFFNQEIGNKCENVEFSKSLGINTQANSYDIDRFVIDYPNVTNYQQNEEMMNIISNKDINEEISTFENYFINYKKKYLNHK